MKELDDFARPTSTLLPLAGTAPPVHLRLITLFMKVQNLIKSRLEDTVALQKELLPVRDIMDLDLWRPGLRASISCRFHPVSPTLYDVCCRLTANLFPCFGEIVWTAWSDAF